MVDQSVAVNILLTYTLSSKLGSGNQPPATWSEVIWQASCSKFSPVYHL